MNTNTISEKALSEMIKDVNAFNIEFSVDAELGAKAYVFARSDFQRPYGQR